MKKYILNCLTIILLVFITSCNLSKFPIDDPPSVKVDPRLLGKWSDKAKEGDQYVLSRQTDYTYHIVAIEKKRKKTDKVEEYDAFLSTVNSATFLNVHCKDDDSTDRYLFVRILEIDPSGNKIRLTSVADTTMENLDNAREVRDYVTMNLNKSTFYHDTTWFYKVK